ncbi:hypothetical protein BT96DRAFT_1090882 [Gymnopus androsaceus JB14]|uniref:Uncharacterized protein n=1 Tax=Gymnopus androsaceus JB14 TaxID=1447944 RepID=A0A6A4IB84_9AGAR|nr:hypothetical protein BT96DRAFT_1090882 [Gymnopus androsaceus JB14]
MAEGYDGRRKRTSSKVSDQSTLSGTAGRTAPTIRPQRHRTTSLASVFPVATDVESTKIHSTAEDHSQTGLEKVIGSRLVETFLAVTATSEPSSADAGLPTSSFSPPATPSSPRNGFPSTSPRKDVTPVHEKSRRDSWARANSPPSIGHSRSLSNTTRGKAVKPAAGSPLASSSAFPSTPNLGPTSIPDYLSPIHQPSTNPTFSVDPKSEFASWTDFSAVKLKIELWAKVGSERSSHVNGKGKEKERAAGDQADWQVLEEWSEINLNELIPLPKTSSEDVSPGKQETSSHQKQLPSNTLLITLNPPGQTFYAPSSSHGRPPSPSLGYSSDPESTVRKDEDHTLVALPSRRRRQRGRQGQDTDKEENVTRTAGWQDLFKLVTTWTTIKDNENSLEDIVRGLDHLIADDQVLPLKREISERECRIAGLRADCANVSTKSQELRDEIRVRRERLRERQDLLAQVEQQDEDDLEIREEIEEDLIDERIFVPTRTTLISILSYLFPIEIRSPPDLLFTILDIPLPIPLTANDPAPPLTLPAHNDCSFLLHIYGHGLVYPITYIGSRSLIRDGISAMVGPRMFPLFSKGVDTYRFEYGVFLLNKNIEILMVEHDLRAIDIRHTLPNLKNLLLTLTDGEVVPVGPPSKRACSPSTSLSGLESPRPESPTETLRGSTPKAGAVDLPSETTPPTSGSSTPTTTTNVSMETLKKTSRFLGFSPLAGFLRVRYPSTILSRNVDEAGPAETDEVAESSSAIDGSDINPERHDADREMDGETQAAGDSALEPRIPAQATNQFKLKGRRSC